MIIEVFRKTLEELNKKTKEVKENKLKDSSEKGTVHVGRTPSLSSFFEKELAKQLNEIYPNYEFYVDYPIRLFKDGKPLRSQNIYPDIMMVNLKNESEGILKAVIEIKLDLGWIDVDKEKESKRDASLKDATEVRFNSLVGAYSDEEKKSNRKINLKVSKTFRKIAIIVTALNEHGRKQRYEEILREKGYNSIFLLEDIHFNDINDYSEEINKELNKPEKKKAIIEAFNGL